jgi:hypothetical protein
MVGVATRRILDEQVRLRHRPGLRVNLLAEEVHAGVGVKRGTEDVPIAADAQRDVLLREHQHPARPAARVVDGHLDPLLPQPGVVFGEHEIDHQVDHVTRREVLAGILVERFVEFSEQLLENRPRRVVHAVRVQIDVLEALHDLEQQPRLVEP